MKINLILFSGFITASIGFVLGIAISEMGVGNLQEFKRNNRLYQNLEEYSLVLGSGLGFAFGAGQEFVRELKENKEED